MSIRVHDTIGSVDFTLTSKASPSHAYIETSTNHSHLAVSSSIVQAGAELETKLDSEIEAAENQIKEEKEASLLNLFSFLFPTPPRSQNLSVSLDISETLLPGESLPPSQPTKASILLCDENCLDYVTTYKTLISEENFDFPVEEAIVAMIKTLFRGLNIRILAKVGRFCEKCNYVHVNDAPESSHLKFSNDLNDTYVMLIREISLLSECPQKPYFASYQDFSLSKCLSIRTISKSVDVEFASESVKQEFERSVIYIKSQIQNHVNHHLGLNHIPSVINELDELVQSSQPKRVEMINDGIRPPKSLSEKMASTLMYLFRLNELQLWCILERYSSKAGNFSKMYFFQPKRNTATVLQAKDLRRLLQDFNIIPSVCR